MSVSDLEWRL